MMTRTLVAAMCASLASFAAAGMAMANTTPIEGVWQTRDDGGQVEIFDCGGKICGRGHGSTTLTAGDDPKDVHNHDPALRNRPLLGLEVIHNFAGGPTTWTGGTLYRPQDGGTYSGSLHLVDPDTLKVTGCLAPILCQSQVWKRVR